MTEKEKMLNGKPYLSFGEGLFEERQAAKELLFDFNASRPSEFQKRNGIIKQLLGKTGATFFIEPPFFCDYGYNISLGENFYANTHCVILDCAKVAIGDQVMLGPNVNLFTAGHPLHHVPRSQGIEYAFPIVIGNYVWIGGGVIVTPGVTIGDKSVIGAGSVVTRDIPPNSIAVGNPCRVIREIIDEDQRYYFRKLPLEQ